ncbi:MAG TPA: hypothetical protein VGX68_07680 [Thermoanaerobaculia bacterium]|jgi:hypothetical protein|nr:hypothetical protein [Thermoanaerobaculia bacterium]
MKREEFERRKRRLEEQLEEGIELLKAGFRQQLRALELVWMTTAEEDEVPPRTATEPAREASAATAAAPQPATPTRPRPKRGQLWEDIDEALNRVPKVFDRHDLVKALGFEPERTALHRVISALLAKGEITLKRRGFGKIPARYELVEDADEEPEEAAT